jgi:SAM-dependent methyltransferase
VGRHSLEFARRGFQVTAVDRTSSYLKKASERSVAEGLNAEFIEADMRTFSRPNTFDCVLNLCTSFGYFEDPREDEQVATNMWHSLKSGGVLLMEMMGKEILARSVQPRRWHEEGEMIILEETTVHKAWSWVESRWIIIRNGERFERTLSHRIYSAVELTHLLNKAGFEQIEVYGDLAGTPYDETAKRLVVVARK